MTRDQALTILNLPATATPEEIAKAYQRLVRRYPPEFHPDRFRQIDEAYHFLTSLPYRLERLFAPEKFTVVDHGSFPYELAAPAVDPEALLGAWRQQLLRSFLWKPASPAANKKRPAGKPRRRSADEDDTSGS